MPLIPFLLNELIDDSVRQAINLNLLSDECCTESHPSKCRYGNRSGCKRRGVRRNISSPLSSPIGTDIQPYVNDKDQFKVHLDVQQFKPEELKVSVDDGFLVVDGKHEERSDEHGFISRQFRRKYKIPEDVDPKTISSQLSSDGVLSLQAQKMIKEGEVRELPITFTDAPLRIQAEQNPVQHES